jgi:hypothetical protein
MASIRAGVRMKDLSGYVYMAMDTQGETIYVGVTRPPWIHRVHDYESAYWWHEAVWFQVFRFDTYGHAQHVERCLIKALRPRHNAHGNPDYHYRPNLRGRALTVRE